MLKLFDEGLLWPDCASDLISLYAHAVFPYDAAINISLLHTLFACIEFDQTFQFKHALLQWVSVKTHQ